MELISVMERSATLEDVEQLAKQFANDGFVIVDTQLPVSDLNALHKAINQKIDSNEIRKSTRSHHSWKTRYSINDDRWLRTPEFARFVTTILFEFAALFQEILGTSLHLDRVGGDCAETSAPDWQQLHSDWGPEKFVPGHKQQPCVAVFAWCGGYR